MGGKALAHVSLDQFLYDLKSFSQLRATWSYTWVLGSGAAAASGVPTGKLLAARWLREIFEVQQRGAPASSFAQWNAAAALSLAGLNVEDPAPFYGDLYKRRFGHQPRLGQEFLRSQILGRTPSYGYAALAQLQTDTSHQCVVTTNFDHLLEDSHRRYLDHDLIVCASDDQASTVQRLPEGPLLAKIHGDIFHETKNDASYIAELRDSWHDPLRTLFKRSAPLFVGYGGNDRGFMHFLCEGVRPGWFPHRPVWAYHEQSGPPQGELVARFAALHDVMFVPIPGFDEFLFLIAEGLDLKPLTKRLEAEFASRVRLYQASYETMANALRAARPQEGQRGGALDRSLAPADQRDWWEWREAARNASTYEEGRKVLEEGLAHLPESPELRSFYAAYRAKANPRDPEAEANARRALEDAERQYGPEHPGTLSCVQHLGNLFRDKGEFATAEPLYRRALEIGERVLGTEHPDTLSSINGLANLLFDKGEYDAAEPLYRRALETRERVLGPDHPDTLTSLGNLANARSIKNDQAAEALYRRALEAQERVRGPEHPETLLTAMNLASELNHDGDHDGAQSLYERVLGTQERVLGCDHPGTLLTVTNLARLFQAKEDYDTAERLCRRALEARERVLGAEHPDTLDSLSDLAALLFERGERESALPLMQRAFEGLERVRGANHANTVIVRGNLEILERSKAK